MPDENHRLNDADRLRRWGVLRWAAWVPDLANALVIILTVIFATASVVRQYSDAELADNQQYRLEARLGRLHDASGREAP